MIQLETRLVSRSGNGDPVTDPHPPRWGSLDILRLLMGVQKYGIELRHPGK